MATTTWVSRRQWLAKVGGAAAGMAVAARFLNEEMRAQTISPERLAATQPVKARLSLNENPFGPAPGARAALETLVSSGQVCRYPFRETQELVEHLAKKEGVRPAQIVLGVGSGELLEAAGIHFGQRQGRIVYATPGYLQLPRAAEAMGATLSPVPLNAKLEHDLEAMAAMAGAATTLFYIANPHNPTGTVVSPGALRAFIEQVTPRSFVFLDEAYLDIADRYGERTMVSLVKGDRPLLVARTFSKIYGLAGLRVGYAVASEGFAEQLRKYSVGSLSGPGVVAALASLRDPDYVATTRAKIVAERDALLATLRELGKTYAEPQGNFVFFKTGRPHAEFASRMMAEGVGVARAFPPLTEWARLTIGLPDENALARAALRKVLG